MLAMISIRKMAKSLVPLLVLAALLAACAPVTLTPPGTGTGATPSATAGTGATSPIATATPLGTATAPAPTGTPTAAPLPTATAAPATPTAGTTPAANGAPAGSDKAVAAAKAALAAQTRAPATDMQLVSAEEVQWPDSCLGIQNLGIMCAMHVTPGYRVTLRAGGQLYEVHTNLDGSEAKIAQAPATAVPASGAAAVVNDFLTALQQDPTGNSALNLLGPALLADVQGGHLLPQIVGIENMYRSFSVGQPVPFAGGQRALVEAGLNFVSPITRLFVVGMENGGWRIETIVSYAVPPMAQPADTADAVMVLLNYTRALAENQPADAFALLTAAAQAKTSAAALGQSLQGMQQITPTSITLTEAGQDRLAFTVTLWVQGNGPTGSWRQGSNTRQFVLTRTDQGWRIDQINTPTV